MTNNLAELQYAKLDQPVIHWLLDSDPSIRWQVMRDLTDATADEVAAERARIATECWGARLLSLQKDDGRWPLEVQYPGKMPVEMDDGEGRPSRWITLRALRVLAWYSVGD